MGFYPVLHVDCLLCDWLAGRACRSGRANDYQLMVGDVVWKGQFLNVWDVPPDVYLNINVKLKSNVT